MLDSTVPLARLFAVAFRSLMEGVHAQLAERGYHDVRPRFGYVLLAVRERPLTGNEVASLMGMTKQAASKLIDDMEHAGYLKRIDHPKDARAKLLRITPKGKRLLATVEKIYADLERAWAEVLGAHELSVLRGQLEKVLRASHGGALPPVRPVE